MINVITKCSQIALIYKSFANGMYIHVGQSAVNSFRLFMLLIIMLFQILIAWGRLRHMSLSHIERSHLRMKLHTPDSGTHSRYAGTYCVKRALNIYMFRTYAWFVPFRSSKLLFFLHLIWVTNYYWGNCTTFKPK